MSFLNLQISSGISVFTLFLILNFNHFFCFYFSCNDERALAPCYCLEKQHKVLNPNGYIRCIPCLIVCQTDDCVAQMHPCENNKPFPEEEAYKCVEPKDGQFIKLGIIETCREMCKKNEVSSGCHCKTNRKCVCPKDTHYKDSVGRCWKCSRCTKDNMIKVGRHTCLGRPLYEV